MTLARALLQEIAADPVALEQLRELVAPAPAPSPEPDMELMTVTVAAKTLGVLT